jgi:tripeptidyl-peptidase-1
MQRVDMFLSHLVVVAIAAFTTDAVPVVLKHVVHERRDAPGSDWVKSTRIEAGAVLPMRIGLTQTNLQNGYDHLMEVQVEPVHDSSVPPH